MAKSGCGFIGGSCRSIAEKCEGCERVMSHNETKYCLAFPDPSVRWRLGNCSMATHIKAASAKAEASKVRVGQQKQKKK
ncbi:MAG: PxxKW family cysteine-rich protein [Deltaproteobacteria bacterium]|nr:PxxKW family cysteine-rich protein [Deltaproteobacteria bacterium]